MLTGNLLLVHQTLTSSISREHPSTTSKDVIEASSISIKHGSTDSQRPHLHQKNIETCNVPYSQTSPGFETSPPAKHIMPVLPHPGTCHVDATIATMPPTRVPQIIIPVGGLCGSSPPPLGPRHGASDEIAVSTQDTPSHPSF